MADFEAEIYFYRTDEGGRSKPVTSGYRSNHDFHHTDGEINDAEHRFLDREWVQPGETVRSAVTLMRPERNAGRLFLNKHFFVMEGGLIVGAGRVTKLINPLLARSRS